MNKLLAALVAALFAAGTAIAADADKDKVRILKAELPAAKADAKKSAPAGKKEDKKEKAQTKKAQEKAEPKK